MRDVTIIGIDPGRVHTGCVAIMLDINARAIEVNFAVITGVDVSKVMHWINQQRMPDAVFVEDYTPSNYAREDKMMSEALGRLKYELPPRMDPIVKYVDNAGVNTLVPVEVQKLFGVHRFPVTTHHNDLNSAGKVALLGMSQDKGGVLRGLASTVVRDALIGQPWVVTVHA